MKSGWKAAAIVAALAVSACAPYGYYDGYDAGSVVGGDYYYDDRSYGYGYGYDLDLYYGTGYRRPWYGHGYGHYGYRPYYGYGYRYRDHDRGRGSRRDPATAIGGRAQSELERITRPSPTPRAYSDGGYSGGTPAWSRERDSGRAAAPRAEARAWRDSEPARSSRDSGYSRPEPRSAPSWSRDRDDGSQAD